MSKMSFCSKLLLFLIVFIKPEADLAITLRKLVYQKDISEYCRRRVMPSVFLGRQVIDAYSQILHFSRLELPYSCFVSIRTESGSNIILVIQLLSDKSLVDSCRESKNQLLVYEIGETFGGYWGALPDHMMNLDPPKDEETRYILKTTEPTTTTTTTEKTTTHQRTKASTAEDSSNKASEKSLNEPDDIIMEVPIVNVSARLEPGRWRLDDIFDFDESYNAMFGTKPWTGASYKTKILPLVQFSVEDAMSALRTDHEASLPQYQVDINPDLFTPDPRLSFPLFRLPAKEKPREKYKYNVNSVLDFKKNKKLLADKEVFSYRTLLPQYYSSFNKQSSNFFTRPYDDFSLPTLQEETNSWEIVNAILKNLSKTKDNIANKRINVDKNVESLLHGLAKIGHNKSVYLVPNTAQSTRRSTTRSMSSKYRTDPITWRQPSASYRTNYLEDIEEVSQAESVHDANKSSNTIVAMNNNDSLINTDVRSGALLPLTLDVDRVILNATTATQQKMIENSITMSPGTLALEVSGTSTSATTPDTVKPMALVDHESWENMVQAASLMAVMLNQSTTANVGDEKEKVNVTLPKLRRLKRRRKKRYIHAIPIDYAKPHHLPTKLETTSTTVRIDRISDVQDFQRFIELQDDEINGRVALRYLHQYVGPALFNICDFDEASARHVYLFNSSRLVLAITNFTLERMTVVMTPARTLVKTDARCAPANLECQVSGARVCIDSLSACDGVPNCGSYDIYDEDRLTCGGTAGLQHHVCLAAITFLAVLLTIMYTVHYWLKRCVPKVSDAFFVYTDAAENVLYLDSIMRSPYDTDDPKDYYRGAAIHDYMDSTDMTIHKSTVRSFMRRFIQFFTCKSKKRQSHVLCDEMIEPYDHVHSGDQAMYPFGLELSKMGSAFMVNAEVQTGSSLEIEVLDKLLTNDELDEDIDDTMFKYQKNRRSSDRSSLDLDIMSSRQPSDELNMLHYFRRARSISRQISPQAIISKIHAHRPSQTEEKEIQCHEYDYEISHIKSDTSIKKPQHGNVQKKLRFQEEKRTIQPESEDEVVEEELMPERRRRSVAYGGSKNVHLENTDSNSDVNEPTTSKNREFKSYFWGSAKNKPKKPTKKKTQLSLR